MTHNDQPRIGSLSMSGKDVDHKVRCNALAFNPAVGGYEAMVMSVIGPSTTLKSIQAALGMRAKVTFHPEDIPGMPTYLKIYRSSEDYRIYRHRMGYATWHMLAISKRNGLMPDSSDESLWRALQSDSITTPMLRSWVPYIKHALTTEGLLVPLRCFGCNASILNAGAEQIDEIVSRGIRHGHLLLETRGLEEMTV